MYVRSKKIHYILLGSYIFIALISSCFSILTKSEHNLNLLSFSLILIITELFSIKRLNSFSHNKVFNHTQFTFVLSILCGFTILLPYLIIVTLFKLYVHKDNLDSNSWKLNNSILFFATLSSGSLTHIITNKSLKIEELITLNNMSVYLLCVILYTLVISIPYIVIKHIDNRSSFLDSQDQFAKINIESIIIHVVYHAMIIGAYLKFGIMGLLLTVIVSYIAEYYIEKINLIKIESVTDALTGAYNRGYLDRLLQKYKTENRRFSAIMLDIDNFKQINENYNHLIGDMILKEFVKVIRNSLRENDVVARYGGEEFVVILENVSHDNVLMIAERIRRNIEAKSYHCTYKEFYYDIKHTASLGVGIYNNKHPNNVIEEADNNLKIAKHTGKNKVFFQEK